MSVYRVYRKLRNYVGTLHLTPSLLAVHAYFQYLEYGKPIPKFVQTHPVLYDEEKIGMHPHAWELEQLTKELILHGSLYATRSFTRWDDLSGAINLIRRLDGEVANIPAIGSGILFEMNRQAHRQFIWQQRNNQANLLRFFKIYSDPDVEPLVKNATGLSAAKLYRLGMAMFGHFSDQMQIDYPFPASEIEVDEDELASFVNRFSRSIFDLQDEIKSEQTFDENFFHRFSPLRAYPIIRLVEGERTVLVAPIPTLLLWRFTEGMYYEVVKESGFDLAYGRSFEKYAGEILFAADTRNRFSVLPQAEYFVGKNRKDSIDWILTDDTANLFIECKTKKLRHESKLSLSISSAIVEDIEKMAEFVVQAYRATNDATAGHYPHWKLNANPNFIVVLTLEEWHASGAPLRSEIDKLVREKLTKAGIPLEVLDQSPYFTCSCKEFEYAVQVMNEISIRKLMDAWLKKRDKVWSLHVFMLNEFRDELRRSVNLFKKDFGKIHPALYEDKSAS